MKFRKQPEFLINTEERNKRFGMHFLYGLGLFLIFASIAVAILIPYINTLPIYITQRVTYNTSYITLETELDIDDHLLLTSKNNETLEFSTDNDEVMFINDEPVYVYGDKAGTESNVSMVFTTSGDYKVTSVDLYLCSEDGLEIYLVESRFIFVNKLENDSTMISYSINKDIFIYSVAISYQLRVK